jgi:hypothetical protein
LNYKHDHLNSEIGDNEEIDPVRIYKSVDAASLKCLNPDESYGDPSNYSMFGFEEYQFILSCPNEKEKSPFDPQDLKVTVEAYEPSIEATGVKTGCSCQHPSSDWILGLDKESETQSLVASETCTNITSSTRNVKIIDLTTIQTARKEHDCSSSSFRLDSPGSVLHFLRSTLTSCHGLCASPWTNIGKLKQDNSHSDQMSVDRVLAVLMRNTYCDDAQDSSSGSNGCRWDDLEKKELKQMINFRTGDAAPSFFLYSVSDLKADFQLKDLQEKLNSLSESDSIEDCSNSTVDCNGQTLLVFRRLPPRWNLAKNLSSLHFGGLKPSPIHEESPRGTLWEIYRKHEVVQSDHDESNILYRIVSAPYQSHAERYPDVLETLMSPENMQLLRTEAKSIPQWTAWPEKNHYESELDNLSDDGQNTYPASWTVFPLCHTFPATDESARKWIDLTCSYTPHTTALLKSIVPVLRTALFSRLDPRTKLGDHTGWADLANHVLRIHIPIEIPTGEFNDGLCGTWVDGCVETHSNDRIISFDDSKLHRAFNYSDEERIVLILDLARPGDFPKGTAVGGHTDELEAFIKQFN